MINSLDGDESVSDEAWSRYDANRDGRVTASDALYVINRLALNDANNLIALTTVIESEEKEPNVAVDQLLGDVAFLDGLF